MGSVDDLRAQLTRLQNQVTTLQRQIQTMQGQFNSSVPYITGQILDQSRIGTYGAVIGATMGAANTDTTITHPLGRTPTGYTPISSKLGGQLYNGSNNGTDWTDKTMVLRSTVANDVVSFLAL